MMFYTFFGTALFSRLSRIKIMSVFFHCVVLFLLTFSFSMSAKILTGIAGGSSADLSTLIPSMRNSEMVSTSLKRVVISSGLNQYGQVIPSSELSGVCDLAELIRSLRMVYGDNGIADWTPAVLQLHPDWENKSIVMNVQTSSAFTEAKLGVHLGYAFPPIEALADKLTNKYIEPLIKRSKVCFGFEIPVRQFIGLYAYQFDKERSDLYFKSLTDADVDLIERLRRDLFDRVGIVGNTVVDKGLGDINLYCGLTSFLDYVWRFRSIGVRFILGGTLPTGKGRDFDFPASIPFGAQGGKIYFDSALDFGLTYRINAGCNFRITSGLPFEYKDRISVFREQSSLSPLLEKINRSSGIEFLFCPYVRLQHLTPDVHLNIGLSLATHFADAIVVNQPRTKVLSYLNRSEVVLGVNVPSAFVQLRNERKRETEWSATIWHAGLTYEPSRLKQQGKCTPSVQVFFDWVYAGKNTYNGRSLGIQCNLAF